MKDNELSESTLAPSASRRTSPVLFVVVLAVIIIGILGGSWAYGSVYQGKILPGTMILGQDVGGRTPAEVREYLDQRIRETEGTHLSVVLDEQTIEIPWRQTSSNSIITYDLDTAIAQAEQSSKSTQIWTRLFVPIARRISKIDITPAIAIDDAAVKTTLEHELGPILIEPKNARLSIEVNGTNGEPLIEIIPEERGRTLDINPIILALHDQANRFSFTPIHTSLTQTDPDIAVADLQPLIGEAQAWIHRAPFALKAEGEQWTITRSMMAEWVAVSSTQPHSVSIDFDKDHVYARLRSLAKDLLKDVQDGNLELAEGTDLATITTSTRINVFRAPEEGIDVDIEATLTNIREAWEMNRDSASMVLTHVEPTIRGDAAKALGIKSLLGVGRSNFTGSPQNRRKNIAIGADRVNFSLVPPNEEFSLLQTLGPIDGEHDWLPELVIKGDKTTPEFGGGLCQIGTTTFRAALAAGLPITERRNHSYRVSYYEPAGTDATIYDPAPDFKFKNDTPGWILLTTRLQGNIASFSVWGTHDGRVAEQTPPRIYNIVQPPPKKIIETTEIPVGTTKCTETAHAGATAEFDYTVTYPNQEPKKITFHSQYKPWQAVCLVGVEELSEDAKIEAEGAKVDETGLNNPTL